MSSPIASASSALLRYLFDPAARSLALGLLAAMVLYVVRAKSAPARLAVWTGLLYAALAMPFLPLLVPAISVPLPSRFLTFVTRSSAASAPAPASPTVVSAAATVETPAPTIAKRSQTDVAASTLLFGEPAASNARATTRARAAIAPRLHSDPASKFKGYRPPDAATSYSKAVVQIASPAPRPTVTASRRVLEAMLKLPWFPIAAVIYLGIAAFLLARIVLGAFLARRLVGSAETIDDPHAIRILLRQLRLQRVASAPRLAESDLVSVPVTVGIFRSVILLPSCWGTWEDAILDAVVAHEASHIARHDALTQHLAVLHRAVFWFSPLAWWLNRAVVQIAEEASDEAALASGADRAFYAETLLGFFAALSRDSRRVYWQGVSMAAPGQAERRLDRVLNWKGAVQMRIQKSLAVSLLLFGVPAVLLAAAARPQAPAPAPAPVAPVPPATAVPAPMPMAAPQLPAAPASPDTLAPAWQVPALPQLPPDTAWTAAVPYSDGNFLRLQTLRLQDMADVEKQMTITMNNMPQFEFEYSQALENLEKQLAEARVKNTEMHPQVQKLEAEIAQLQAQMQTQAAEQGAMQAQKEQAETLGRDIYRVQVNPEVNPMVKIGGVAFFRGNRYVIVSSNSPMFMSGDPQDLQEATSLRAKINGDYIWFQREDKSYVIRDKATVEQAKAFFKPQQDLGEQQSALGKQQSALGKQQSDLGKKMQDTPVTVPDMSADLQKLEAQMKQLNSSNATRKDLGDVQRQLGDLQRRLAEAQRGSGDQMSQVGQQMRDLGEKQRDLGAQQRDLGRRQRDAATEANRQMKQLLDDAISKGTAQPE